MVLKLAWMYYDLLEVYGDRGNVKALEYISKKNNIDLIIDKITITDDRDISDYDIVFLGGGTDNAQMMMYDHLISKKKEIENILDKKGFILTICGGYQLFGKYYIDTLGNKIDGLGLFDFYSIGGKNRSTGNIIINAKLNEKIVKIVGFENHGGQTKNVEHPFGEVLLGNGNESNSNYEGYFYENFLGTYIHGPLIPKNPEIAKHILEYILKNKYNNNEIVKIDMLKNAFDAKEYIISREAK